MDIDESAGIDYTLEYILCGKSGDKENLEQTMLELSGIRTGMNLAYLITDKSKKNAGVFICSRSIRIYR